MYKMILLLIVFLVVVYVYSIIKIKKNKENTKNLNSVQEFHNSYQHLIDKQQNVSRGKSNQYNYYVTKYNSSEDYREKN